MGIPIASSFTRQAAVPIDEGSIVADMTARDAIDPGIRFEGMIVYVVSAGTNYQLIGGILDANWEELSGGGGGGLALSPWVQGDGAAPERAIEYGREVYKFAFGDDQHLFSSIPIPPTYTPGTRIRLRMAVYSPSILGDALLQITSTLINPDDDIGSTTNQHVSTNTALDLTTGVSGALRFIDFDITDADGENNGTLVQPNADVGLDLSRGSDTSETDFRAMVHSYKVVLGD